MRATCNLCLSLSYFTSRTLEILLFSTCFSTPSLFFLFFSPLLTVSFYSSICRGKTGFAIAINLMYGMASLSSTFALLLVTESSIKSKHVQQVSGVYLSNFWFSALLWDLVNFLMPCLLMLVSMTFHITWWD